ncbi:hypothetical protein [Pleomorphomonas sp. JP5]|uniref:hypothetical protein n=1 Tax=Pleomorphomonas sp. JP5 TaxID=2942998 RepID=UPI0020446060|nr:hypothetical protein [Pleomorphomonas sp. JP5]MCM5558529.1 hypothetical protein [Pleomorphomonas sp. JP5]
MKAIPIPLLAEAAQRVVPGLASVVETSVGAGCGTAASLYYEVYNDAANAPSIAAGPPKCPFSRRFAALGATRRAVSALKVEVTFKETTMRIRIMLTLLIYLIVQGVLFGIGMVIVMATPLEEQADVLVPWAVGLSFIIAVPVAMGIAPRMKAWREMRSRRRTEETRL